MTVASLALALALAAAGPLVDRAADELRRDPVYVSPDAAPSRTLSEGEASELRRRIASSGRPVFVAVLPDAAAEEAGGLDRLPAALGEATGLAGTYAVVTGQGFRAASSDLPSGMAGSLATSAFQAARDNGVAAVLEAFVARVDAAGSGSGGAGAAPADPGDGGDGGGSSSVLPLLLVGGAVGGGLWAMSRRRREVAAVRATLDADREDLRAELTVLADDVMRLEPEVAIHPEARDDYEAGVARFRWAQVAVDAVDSADDIPRVRRALAEGAYAMARARAVVRGDEPPPPPAELTRPGPYGEPAVELDPERRPVYAGFGGGWGGGGFFGGNGLFAGLLLGQMLGGGLGGAAGGATQAVRTAAVPTAAAPTAASAAATGVGATSAEATWVEETGRRGSSRRRSAVRRPGRRPGTGTDGGAGRRRRRCGRRWRGRRSAVAGRAGSGPGGPGIACG